MTHDYLVELEQLRVLRRLVAQMREAQRAYFKTKKLSDLQAAKRLESIVDLQVSKCLALEPEPAPASEPPF